MKHDPERPRRRSIRLKGYDYTQAGAYFVTICARNRECLFGNIANGEVSLNVAGRMTRSVWDELPNRFSGLELDAFVVMPNHVHGIFVLVGAGLALPGLGDIVRAFKSLTAVRVNRLLMRTGPLWQRNYYEHIIRNEKELNLVREYIANNPLQWELDRENPICGDMQAKDEPWFC